MVRMVLLSLVSLILFSTCTEFKPKPSGDDEEILVFADDDAWQALERPLREALQDTVWTPIPEPWYVLRRVPFDQWGHYEQHMNRIVAASLTGKGPVSAFMRNSLDTAVQRIVREDRQFMFNKYNTRARDQLLMFLAADDLTTLAASIRNQRTEILYSFESMSLRRETAALESERAYHKKDVEGSLLRRYGWTMTIQHDYHVAIDSAEAEFFWVRRATPADLERWIFVHWMDAPDPSVLTEEFVLKLRERVTEQHLRTVGDEAYVEMAPYHLKMEEVNFLGRFAIKTRGNWRFSDKSGGGPFVNYAFYDETTRRIYMLDGSVFAPRVAKRDLILQVDAILRTFKSANDLTEEERKELGG